MLFTDMMPEVTCKIILTVKKPKNRFFQTKLTNFGLTGSTFSKSQYT